METLDTIREHVKHAMHGVARLLNRMSAGKISPNSITMIGLLAHIPIAWLIALQHYILAAILLIIFGLFDSLDGELARLQHRVSNAGMLLDATADRIKEIFLYLGIAYAFISMGQPGWAVWAVAACGFSLLVSYVKAKGETAVVNKKLNPNEINTLFKDGFMRYEIRMTTLVIALLINQLGIALVFIAVAAWWTAINRLVTISEKLK